MIKSILRNCTKQVAKVGRVVIDQIKPRQKQEEIDQSWEECKSDAKRIWNDIQELLYKE